MGTQVVIQLADIESAGWEISYEKYEIVVGETYEGDPIWETGLDTVICKDGYRFKSYCEEAFVADCNSWGPNKPLFEQVGLLDLPHVYI